MTNPDSGIVIIATLTATPQNRDHLLRALQELLPAARAESGVYTFLSMKTGNSQANSLFTNTFATKPRSNLLQQPPLRSHQQCTGPIRRRPGHTHLPPTTPSHRNSGMAR